MHETATRLVESDAFESAWLQANRVAHEQLVAVMRGEDGDVLQVSDDGRLSIQLSGLIDLLKERLVDRGLDVAARIPSVDATFTVAQSAELVMLQNRYAQVVTLTTWLPWVVLGLLAAGSSSRTTARARSSWPGSRSRERWSRWASGSPSRGACTSARSGQVVRLDAAEVVFDQAVGYLRLTLRTVGVLGLVVALAAYVAGRARRPAACVQGWAVRVPPSAAGARAGASRRARRRLARAAQGVRARRRRGGRRARPAPGGHADARPRRGVALVAGLVLVVVEFLARPTAVGAPPPGSGPA